jgi:hypothetical protein
MEAFQKFILFGAIILLIITLVFIGMSLSKTQADQQWPPIIPECPDYWTIDGSGNNASCINTNNLGTCQPPSGSKYLTMNFNTPAFSGINGSCAKYTWAKKCGISWDGITYGVNNPCQTLSK